MLIYFSVLGSIYIDRLKHTKSTPMFLPVLHASVPLYTTPAYLSIAATAASYVVVKIKYIFM